MDDFDARKREIEEKLKARESAREKAAEVRSLEAKVRVLELEDKHTPTLGEMGVTWDICNLTLFGIPEALFVVKIPDATAVKIYRRIASSANGDEYAAADQLLFAGGALVEPAPEVARPIFEARPGMRALVVKVALILAGYVEEEKKS